jgi:hypothetical protein
MIRAEIESIAQAFSAEERWEKLRTCGAHDWQTLPMTDSREHYCPNCWSLWDSSGQILNLPPS